MAEDILRLSELFTYDPNTGKLYYKSRKFENPSPRQKQWNTRFAGREAGYDNQGYLRVQVIDLGKEFYVHQIAFAIMKGYIPEEIDHEDTNRVNNKWENLREATHTQNMQNVNIRYFNQSGFKGVSWSKWANKWRMDIRCNNIRYHSFHNTREEAYEAYCDKSAELHGEFGRG